MSGASAFGYPRAMNQNTPEPAPGEAARLEASRLEAARAFARERHEGTGPCHDFSHVERVYRLAERIAASEGADLFVVRLAALLHDVGRGLEPRIGPDPDRHEELSAELAEPFLRGLGLDEARVSAVLEAVLRHRHRRGRAPESLEARCLYDADKLDSLGAVGAARAYLWLGEHGRSVHYPEASWAGVDPANNATEVDSFQREWSIKLRHLRERLYTAEGRRLADRRHERMLRILGEIEDEVAGGS